MPRQVLSRRAPRGHWQGCCRGFRACQGAAGSGRAPSPGRRDGCPVAEEKPLVLAVEPRAPVWAQHTVCFLQTGELPEEQEEVEKVARWSALYQFVDDALCKKRPNGVKLKCIPLGGRTRAVGRDTWRHMWLPHRVEGPCRQGIPARLLLAHRPPGCDGTSNQV